jgi:DNA-binding LacI/PurR family transcriptional regulator
VSHPVFARAGEPAVVGSGCVVGSDNVPAATLLNPGLTTVHAPKGTMGRAAVSLLLDHMGDRGPVIEETLIGHLVVRESTAPPRTTN